MKRLAALLLVVAFAGAVGAEEKVVVPVGRPSAVYPGLSGIDVWLEGIRPPGEYNGPMFMLGLPGDAASLREITLGGLTSLSMFIRDRYDDPTVNTAKPTGERIKERELVTKVANNISRFVFPELGDSTEFAFGVCVCGHSVIANTADEPTSKKVVPGGCMDAMICSVVQR